jgi:taurine dioxygenase
MAIAEKEEIRFERVTPTVGAQVHGVQLAGPHPALTQDVVRRALHEYGVLFFDYDHALSVEEFHDFAALFGEPEPYGLSTWKGDGDVMDAALVPMEEYKTNVWHHDGSLFERPPQAAMLTVVEAPEVGGDTMWASMYAAFEALSSHYQRLLEGLEVLHSAAKLPFLKNAPSTAHPAVITDPVVGRKLLYVNENYSERILDMSERESDALLAMLFQHVNTPEFHCRLHWQPGRVAVWEERAVQHRGVAGHIGPRKMRRITFPGDRPAA